MNTAEMSRIVELALGDYAGVRNEYRTRIFAEIVDFLANGANVNTKINAAKRAINDAFNSAGDMGYEDGGGTLPLDEDTLSWLNGRRDGEFANVSILFSQLYQTRKDPDFDVADADDIANTRADGYALTLDGIYSEAKTRGAGNLMLTFGGEDGHTEGFPCPECKKLKGQRHRASWWISRGLIPYPGNSNFTCGTWQCKHFLFDDEGNLFTI